MDGDPRADLSPAELPKSCKPGDPNTDHDPTGYRRHNRMLAVPASGQVNAAAISVDLGDGTVATIRSLADLREMKLAPAAPATWSTSPSLTSCTGSRSPIRAHASTAAAHAKNEGFPVHRRPERPSVEGCDAWRAERCRGRRGTGRDGSAVARGRTGGRPRRRRPAAARSRHARRNRRQPATHSRQPVRPAARDRPCRPGRGPRAAGREPGRRRRERGRYHRQAAPDGRSRGRGVAYRRG